jgi:thiamine-phosphate pyrophosphorylase
MNAAFPRRGLYAINSEGLRGETLMDRCEQVLRGGAVVLQYRDKSGDKARRLGEARGLRALTRRHGVPLIINDDLELAIESRADGVHLGRDDVDPATARRRLGADAIIGISCYDQPRRALEAQEHGADYVAFGRFFSSFSKPSASAATIETLREARPGIHVPVVAIGGINPENGPLLLEAGADLLAVIGALFDAPEPADTAAEFTRLFEHVPHSPTT